MISLLSQTLYPAETKIPENFKLYAHMMLLYNENVHFVNKIETEKISANELFEDEAVNHSRYIKYMNSIKDAKLKSLADKLLHIYKNINDNNAENLTTVEKSLEKENILTKFVIENGSNRVSVDYIFYGKREKLTVKSPFFKDSDDCYNIIPFIRYDEFSTTNTTFHKNHIFIKNDEMIYDYKTLMDILSGKNSISTFLGVPIDNNIKKAVSKAYSEKNCTFKDIRRLTEILLITMKLGTDKLQITKTELNRACGISAVINDSPYEGLIILFAYLQYNKKTEYSIAAKNFIKFASEKTGNMSISDDPSLLITLEKNELKSIANEYFLNISKNRKLY